MENEKNKEIKEEKDKVKKIVEDVDLAAIEDIELNKEGKPAINKFYVLEQTYETLLNKKIHQELLDSGILIALKKWLEPLPDYSMPSDNVKRKILYLLLKFEPEVEHLIESEIGKIILFFSRNPYEKKEIKQIAKKLMVKWIKIAKEEE